MFRRITSVFVAVLFALFLQPMAANADTRINLSANSSMVLTNTFSTITPGQSVAESNGYDWSKFKFEILALNKRGFVAKTELTQFSSIGCNASARVSSQMQEFAVTPSMDAEQS